MYGVLGAFLKFYYPKLWDKKSRSPQSGITGKIITHISLISYSLYLTHGYLILGHLIRYKNEYFDKQLPHTSFMGIVYFSGYLLVSIIVSTILYYTVEITFMSKRTKEMIIIG